MEMFMKEIKNWELVDKRLFTLQERDEYWRRRWIGSSFLKVRMVFPSFLFLPHSFQ